MIQSSLSNSIKKIEDFSINGSSLKYKIEDFPFTINSFPRKYSVSCIKDIDQYISLEGFLKEELLIVTFFFLTT